MPWVARWEKVAGPVTTHVFMSIDGLYSMIIGENGAYNPALPANFNSLHYIAPGCAYWINMKESSDLVYSSASTGTSIFTAFTTFGRLSK